MPITAVCECGKNYTLKDEYANKHVKCPSCGGSFMVPASERVVQAEPIFDRDKFLVRQKRIAVSTKYFVGDEAGQEIAFVHRPAGIWRLLLIAFAIVALIMVVIGAGAALGDHLPRGPQKDTALPIVAVLFLVAGSAAIVYLLAPVRHVTFYRDRGMREKLMVVRQDFKIAFINARYVLVDGQGATLAVLRKNHLYNFIRKRWVVEGPDGRLLCVAIEDSIVLSILRRFAGPALGLLRTNFVIMTPDFEQLLGEFNRKLTLFDKYVLDLTADPNRTLDRRVALALGVMLDTGENR